ncbi:MAG: hypothetical protein OXU81_06965, partial [Gammaproteobacteria bacterium]|nr:hypothetical protein [Gammaproteobacteria bacterium]
MIAYRHADPRFPFLREDSSQSAGRWSAAGELTHYFCDLLRVREQHHRHAAAGDDNDRARVLHDEGGDQDAREMAPRVLGSTERCGRPDDILPAMRFFNTEGPVVAEDHYCIPPLERIDHAEVLELIRRKRYFVLHAPRQTGKTSALL